MDPADLPDLTTPEGLAVASDLLQEAGWPRCEMTLDGLWSVCPEAVLHELACRYAERVLPIWEAEHFDGDLSIRPHDAIASKRLWLGGIIEDEVLRAAWRGARHALRQAQAEAGILPDEGDAESEAAREHTCHAIDCVIRAAEGAALGPSRRSKRPAKRAASDASREARGAAEAAALAAGEVGASAADAEGQAQLALTVAYMLEVGH